MSKKILFPTDFSDASKNAFIYALKLADHIQAEIVTVHVYKLPQAKFVNAAEYLHEVYDVTQLSHFENYRDEVPTFRAIAQSNNLTHVKISHVLISGETVPEIKKLTENDAYELVIMGTKGGSTLKETFFGTIATQVMNEIKTLVLVIPENCQYVPIQKIVFMTKYKVQDTASFGRILVLSQVYKAHLNCLSILSTEDIIKNDEIENWKLMASDSNVTFHSINGNDKEKIILDFIDAHTINMVALHVYHKNFFQKLFDVSLSKKLALHINVPILAIQDQN
ncbi:nucleotide-binding universal stress UspA family protein [Flavobacterium sp. PL11]|jgi:nucleotide-binding universal stress UspA family protein|uniref:universal stress protein n=1 Tax=Flavobacterium sp. PL11 TaxID=3071717 RepID=UPI002E0BC893|nr:nucleotide-binding universal stress UspA family protein [Flavobacterium sp. PL11]